MPFAEGPWGAGSRTIRLVVGMVLFFGCQAQHAAAARLPRRVAVLPFLPALGADPAEGWRLAVKLLPHLGSGREVLALDWRALSRVMEEHRLDKRKLANPAELRRLGKILDVEAIVGGSFKAEGMISVAKAFLLNIKTGESEPAGEWRMDRDLVVAPPRFSIEPPVLDMEDSLAMREGSSDYDPCESAHDRVDAMERRILDVKARYWALQLSRGVAYRTIKFNPGSTISDPDLMKEFYQRMKQWGGQAIIPELSPLESKQFAETEEKAFNLARQCAIL